MPGETKKQIWNTIKLNRRLKATVSAVNIFYPYRGTVLGDKCFNEGLVDEEKYKNFSQERRDTVLKFSAGFRDDLLFYHKYWGLLVNPYDLRKWIMLGLKKTGLYTYARALKRRLGQNLWVANHMGNLKSWDV